MSERIISEAHEDFDTKASPAVKKATEIAHRASGVVHKTSKWGEHASGEEWEQRRQESLANEKKADAEVSKVLGAGEIRAKYKIEVIFGSKRTTNGPNNFVVQVWESGKKLHGGGDDLMFRCFDTETNGQLGCGKFISSDYVKHGIAYCPYCKKGINAERLARFYDGKQQSSKQLAQMLVELFRILDSNADIYLKYHKTDMHYVALERAKGPEVARRLKGMAIYPLKNILKDTSAGADLGKRFYAFVTN